jgi:hypothetical protein
MWPFSRTKKREYETLWEWSEEVGEMPNTPEGQSNRIDEMVQVRRRIWERHLATLTPEEQQALRNGSHASSSWKNEELAQPFATELHDHLVSKGFPVVSVHLGLYHGDRIVMSVRMENGRLTPEVQRRMPNYYRGYEIKLGEAPATEETEPISTTKHEPSQR